jgi:hypothetical protein
LCTMRLNVDILVVSEVETIIDVHGDRQYIET